MAPPNVQVIAAQSAQMAHMGGLARLMRLDTRSDLERVAAGCIAAKGWKQDAGLTMAFARSLEHIFVKVLAAEFAEYRAHEFFPTDTEVEPGALSFTYRMTERLGNAAVISASARSKNLPKVSLAAQEWQSPVITLGASYDFSVIEQMQAAMMQLAIEAEKAKATREAMAALEESIYATGFANAGVPGVTTAPGVASSAQASSGTWIAQILAGLATGPLTATIVQALAGDLAAAKFKISSLTLKRLNATDVLLPTNLYDALDFVPESPLFNSKNLLTWMEEFINLDIDYWPILNNAGALNGSPIQMAAVSASNPALLTRVVVYERNEEVMRLIQAAPFTQLAPQPVGLAWEIPTYSRIGGAMGQRPLGLVYIDGL